MNLVVSALHLPLGDSKFFLLKTKNSGNASGKLTLWAKVKKNSIDGASSFQKIWD